MVNVIEIKGCGSLEQADNLINTAIKTGAELVHIRNSKLTNKELNELKGKHKKIIFDIENNDYVLSLTQNVKKGTVITRELITLKKGQNGITKELIDKIIGKRTLYNIKKGTILTFGLIDL